MQPVHILIVDDQPRARQSLKALLSTWPQPTDIREATNGQEAVDQVEASRPDLVVMDVRMPEMDGLDATRAIKLRWPNVKIIALSMYPEYVELALAAGADAFVGKGETPDRLLDAVALIATGVRA